MKKNSPAFIILLIIAFTNTTKSQTSVSIPAFTAYAVSAVDNEDNERNLFSEKNGLQNWANTSQQIQFYFNLRKTGQLSLALLLKNDVAGNKLSGTFAGKKFSIIVPKSSNFKKIIIGNVPIKESGFYVLT